MPPTPRERATVLPDPSPFVSWNSFLYQRKVCRCTHRSVFHTAGVSCELSTVNSFQKTAHHNMLLDPNEVPTPTRCFVVRARHDASAGVSFCGLLNGPLGSFEPWVRPKRRF